MNTPNTFIVGAPKCGTTALCHYLGSHPNVFMCDPKEPHFFAHEDMPGRKHYYKDRDKYLALFDTATPNHSTIAEGSVWYLFADTAIEKIYQFSPDAKIIVMLRRPDEMVYSYHSQALVSFNEDIKDFEIAWKASTRKNPPRPIPTQCDEPRVLEYGEIARYGTQLSHLFSIFPKEQVIVLLFEDLVSDTQSSYTSVLNFLNIPLIYPKSFEKVNENKVVRNEALGKLLTYPPKPILKITTSIKKLLGVGKLNLRKKLLNAISSKQRRSPLNEALRLEIVDHYRSEILTTQKILNRDLSHWLK